MKLRALLLLLMIGYDASLHIAELIGKIDLYPLYINFPLFGFIPYDLFWVTYWGFGFILMLSLLGSGVTVKHTTEIHNHPAKIKKEKKEEKDDGKPKVIILDDNPLSINCYAEEFPENWKNICDALDKEKEEEKDEN